MTPPSMTESDCKDKRGKAESEVGQGGEPWRSQA
jgi:hypothetical protein